MIEECSQEKLDLARLGRLSEKELNEVLEHCNPCKTCADRLIRKGRLYKHKGGRIYEIICTATNHSTKELFVVYKPTSDPRFLCRSAKSFLEPVKYGRPRFLELPKRKPKYGSEKP